MYLPVVTCAVALVLEIFVQILEEERKQTPRSGQKKNSDHH